MRCPIPFRLGRGFPSEHGATSTTAHHRLTFIAAFLLPCDLPHGAVRALAKGQSSQGAGFMCRKMSSQKGPPSPTILRRHLLLREPSVPAAPSVRQGDSRPKVLTCRRRLRDAMGPSGNLGRTSGSGPKVRQSFSARLLGSGAKRGREDQVMTPGGPSWGFGATGQLGPDKKRDSGAVFRHRGRLWSTLSLSMTSGSAAPG